MMYLAPRQGLFAIIILVSFCLQTLFLVVSTDQQLTTSHAQKGEQMVTQLINEARLSVENKDRVSLSVIANRYTSEQEVARLVIKDNNDDVLVSLGNAPMQQGDIIEQVAMNGDVIIGSVALTLKDVSKGEIIVMQWPFVIASLILHLLLWVAYGYIARPTKAQIKSLSHKIDDLHRDKYAKLNPNSPQRTRQSADSAKDNDKKLTNKTTAASTDPANENSDSAVNTNNSNNNKAIPNKPNTSTKSQQNSSPANEQIEPSSKNKQVSNKQAVVSKTDSNNSQDKDSDKYKPSVSHSKLSANRAYDSVSVQIRFFDEYKMLERLTPEMRNPYLALCSQLFNQALIELLKQPLLQGVSATNTPHFNDKGAVAVLKADNSNAKLALAGVMLGKLFLMLNKIIHDKHIELSRFALPVIAGVSDSDQSVAMSQLLKKVGRKEQMFILLPNSGLKEINNSVQLQHLKRPTTMYERECAVFEGGSDTIIQRLTDARNAVLMTGNEDH